MYKMFFIDLTNVGSQIDLALIKAGKERPTLNWTTVRIYHVLHGTGK